MEVFRIHNRRYDALDARGAARIGGRWNHPGVPLVYASRTYEGALLEQLVHAGIGRLPGNRVASRIVLPEDVEVAAVDPGEHPDWHREAVSRGIGGAWSTSGSSLALLVPSSVARPWGQNVLINPGHEGFGSVLVAEVIDVVWDPRLP